MAGESFLYLGAGQIEGTAGRAIFWRRRVRAGIVCPGEAVGDFIFSTDARHVILQPTVKKTAFSTSLGSGVCKFASLGAFGSQSPEAPAGSNRIPEAR